MTTWHLGAAVALALLLVACGSSSEAGGGDGGDGGAGATGGAGGTAGTGGVAGSSGVSGAAGTSGGTGGGSSSITGSVAGQAFTAAQTSLWIGAADSAATTVVYVFSAPVACADISSPGWDKRITNGTQVLEMKMYGVQPAIYSITPSPSPSAGQASVNYTLSSTSGAPQELGASSGTVTLDTLTANTQAAGSFSVIFASGNLDGAFVAPFCPGGTEP